MRFSAPFAVPSIYLILAVVHGVQAAPVRAASTPGVKTGVASKSVEVDSSIMPVHLVPNPPLSAIRLARINSVAGAEGAMAPSAGSQRPKSRTSRRIRKTRRDQKAARDDGLTTPLHRRSPFGNRPKLTVQIPPRPPTPQPSAPPVNVASKGPKKTVRFVSPGGTITTPGRSPKV